MTEKTFKRYVDIFKGGIMTEKDIIAFRAQLNKRIDNPGIEKLKAICGYELVYHNGFDITPEQTIKGINYLKRKTYKLNGKLRKNNVFNEKHLEILNNFEKFKLVGFHFEPEFNCYVPVYRVISNNSFFDYTGVQYDYIRILK